MSSRFVRPVVVQVGRHDRERVIFDVNDAATILLRSFPHQTEKRKLLSMHVFRFCVVKLRRQMREGPSLQRR
jgi:hypothetical protein